MDNRDARAARCPIPAMHLVFDLAGGATVGSCDPQQVGTVLICDPGSVRRPPRSARTRPADDPSGAGDVHAVRRDVRDGRRRWGRYLHQRRSGPARPRADHRRGRRDEHEHPDPRSSPQPQPARPLVQRRDGRRLDRRFGDEARHAALELWKLRHRVRPPRRGQRQAFGGRPQALTTPCSA